MQVVLVHLCNGLIYFESCLCFPCTTDTRRYHNMGSFRVTGEVLSPSSANGVGTSITHDAIKCLGVHQLYHMRSVKQLIFLQSITECWLL
jgi:hypothetical protein